MRGIHSYATIDCSYPRGDESLGSPVLVWDFRQGAATRVRDVTLISDDSSTLAHVFALSEKIELNMVEEKVVTSGFSKDITITYRGQQSTSQPCSGGGGSRGG